MAENFTQEHLEIWRELFCDICPKWWGCIVKHKPTECDRIPGKPECEIAYGKRVEADEVFMYLKSVRGFKGIKGVRLFEV